MLSHASVPPLNGDVMDTTAGVNTSSTFQPARAACRAYNDTQHGHRGPRKHAHALEIWLQMCSGALQSVLALYAYAGSLQG